MVYDAIKGKSRITPALFVKEMALAVFGANTLLVSTITGNTSNRSKSKKITNAEQEILKLDPVKLMAIRDITFHWMTIELKKDASAAEMERLKVSKYISHKLSELKRTINKTQGSVDIADNDTAEKEVNGNNVTNTHIGTDVITDEITSEITDEITNEITDKITETDDNYSYIDSDDEYQSSSEADRNIENGSDKDNKDNNSDIFSVADDNDLISRNEFNINENNVDPLFIDPVNMDSNIF
ncbi:coiled-coil domain-containing protein 1-like [Leptopilina heterotoma]|uniref:coiled-coil domain-containing protein 1-like n=1 Tax=Leptopilina heterotoma TaxID=63436 RepID=UPI001CA7EDA5|nr:coiled-coil domain-containing protein 1-like [Leptopilina heterotoma]